MIKVIIDAAVILGCLEIWAMVARDVRSAWIKKGK